jgi:hypothetical protein
MKNDELDRICSMYEDEEMPNKFTSKTLMERDQMVDQELCGGILAL